MYGYKPEKARQLLNEAGWIDTNNQGILQKNGRPFEIELLVTTGEANADMVAIVVQSQLKKLGIDLKILTRLDGWDKRLKGEYDLFLHHSGCLPSIPGGIGIGGKYHSKGDWPYAYHSKQLDTLIESVFTTPDNITNERGRLNTIWELLHDASPCIPLYDIKKAVVMNKKVQEFKHGPTMFDMNLTDIIITQ
jgi:peptide/nickel transport system substrate-binding protein